MRFDLAPDQWDAEEAGTLTAPGGRLFTRRTTRAKRRVAAELVAAGCPVVTHWPGGLPEKTRLVWHDGRDAVLAWEEVSPRLISEPPQPRKGESATGGLWESQEGEPLLLLTWHH